MTDPAVGTWASFGYRGNGMLSDIFHDNGVAVDHERDPNSMGRPRSIATTGVAAGADWSTGPYRYDGAGNITNIGDASYVYDLVSRVENAPIPLVAEASLGPEVALIFADGFESGDTSAWSSRTISGAASQLRTRRSWRDSEPGTSAACSIQSRHRI